MLISRSRKAIIYETKEGKRPFEQWLNKLKDVVGQAKVLARIERAESGNFGNYKDLGSEIYEIKESYGPGYRTYFSIDKKDLILLLMGGTKASQESDIQKARKYWKEYKQR
jgi:putative addiction module killer protein